MSYRKSLRASLVHWIGFAVAGQPTCNAVDLCMKLELLEAHNHNLMWKIPSHWDVVFLHGTLPRATFDPEQFPRLHVASLYLFNCFHNTLYC